MNRQQRTRQRARGFTLLELVVVIIILAVLAGMAVPRYLKTVNRSYGAEALSILGELRASASRYYARTGDYSNMTMADLDFDPTQTTGAQHFTYDEPDDLSTTTFSFTATRSVGTGHTIKIDQAGTVTGTGDFSGI